MRLGRPGLGVAAIGVGWLSLRRKARAMSRRVRLAVAMFVCLVTTLLLAFALTRRREPSWNGRLLSDWLALHANLESAPAVAVSLSPRPLDANEEQVQAVRHSYFNQGPVPVGTNPESNRGVTPFLRRFNMRVSPESPCGRRTFLKRLSVLGVALGGGIPGSPRERLRQEPGAIERPSLATRAAEITGTSTI